MMPLFLRRRPVGCLALAVTTVLLFGTVTARAADGDKPATALDEVPADAAFYRSMLRNREQYDAVVKSKAWAKLMDLPTVRDAWQTALLFWNLMGADAQNWYQVAENKQLVDLLGDMVSQEVFVYGGPNSVDFAEVANDIYNAARYGPTLMKLTRQDAGLTDDEVMATVIFQALLKHADHLQAPDAVIGFKLTKTDPVGAQLKRLEAAFKEAADKEPELKGRLKREKIEGGEFLTFKMDGKLVPWEQLLGKLKEREEEKGQFDSLVKKLQAIKLTIALGVRKDYLLVSLGDSTAPLTRLGQGKKLKDEPELKPLAKFADKRLTNINYVSKALATKTANPKRDMDEYGVLLDAALKKVDLPEERKSRLRKNAAELVKDLKKLVPAPGASLSFSFLSERGFESYTHDWAEQNFVDGSKTLPLLEHLGGSPLFALVGRGKMSPDVYPTVVKLVKLVHEEAQDIVLPLLEPNEREKFKKFSKILVPLMKRMDQATQQLLPALADGQYGLVLDGKLKSHRWLPTMPESAAPLPLPEVALLVGVSDAPKLEKAFADYRGIVNEFLVKYHKEDQDFPEVQIPAPKSRKVKDATLFHYDVSEHGLDKQLLPNALVSDKLAIVSLSSVHSERLLVPTPLKVDGGPLANLKRPLAGAVYLDWPALVDALTPWVEYGVRTSTAVEDEGAKQKLEATVKQVREALDLLKVIRGYTSATYAAGGALVTHSETVIRDVR